jgi:hypothetical protein
VRVLEAGGELVLNFAEDPGGQTVAMVFKEAACTFGIALGECAKCPR